MILTDKDLDEKLQALVAEYAQIQGHLENAAFLDSIDGKRNSWERQAYLKAQMDLIAQWLKTPQEKLSFTLDIIRSAYAPDENELTPFVPLITAWYEGKQGMFKDLTVSNRESQKKLNDQSFGDIPLFGKYEHTVVFQTAEAEEQFTTQQQEQLWGDLAVSIGSVEGEHGARIASFISNELLSPPQITMLNQIPGVLRCTCNEDMRESGTSL
jgi:hypothetical protein